MDSNRLRENLDLLWYASGAGDPEKVASVDYFHSLQKEASDKEMLGENFCKLAEALDDDPWLVADDVLNNFDVYQKLAKTASDTKAGELARFYVGWAEELEKKAAVWDKMLTGGRSALKGLKSFFTGAKAAPKVDPYAAYKAGRSWPRPTRAEFMRAYASPQGKGRLSKTMQGRQLKQRKIDVKPKHQQAYQAPKGGDPSLGDKLLGGGLLLGLPAAYFMTRDPEPQQPYAGQYYRR